MQEWESIVSQECDVGIVNEGGEVEGVTQEGSQKITRAAGE